MEELKMIEQISFKNDQPTLFLVTTPIGNLKDFTLRGIDTLRSVSVIFAEDTRVSKTLLRAYEIETRLLSYHEHNKESASKQIIEYLKGNQDIALISDAGVPLISDPGYLVINEALKNGFNVVSIGAGSAYLNALVCSGLPVHPHTFYGFLDANSNKRKEQLEHIKTTYMTSIFYVSVHQVSQVLRDLYDVVGDREIVLARELTKQFETIYRGMSSEFIDLDKLKGEFVLLIKGVEHTPNHQTFDELMEYYTSIEGLSKKDAIKQIAKDKHVHKNIVYQYFMKSGD
jgi:16S rRNA (cytidine1402-2'-O)-methyltransferase